MKDLESRFNKAYEISSSMQEKLPPDTMLKLYAYYKQATKGQNYSNPSGDDEIRNAFKLNALMQANNLTIEEAKEAYIKLVGKLTDRKI